MASTLTTALAPVAAGARQCEAAQGPERPVVTDRTVLDDLLGRVTANGLHHPPALPGAAGPDDTAPCLEIRLINLSPGELRTLLGARAPALPAGERFEVTLSVVASRTGTSELPAAPLPCGNAVHPLRSYPSRLDALTCREREVHDMMVMGKTSKAIAVALGGSFRTIEIHRGRVMRKMVALNLSELVRMACEGAPAPN